MKKSQLHSCSRAGVGRGRSGGLTGPPLLDVVIYMGDEAVYRAERRRLDKQMKGWAGLGSTPVKGDSGPAHTTSSPPGSAPVGT